MKFFGWDVEGDPPQVRKAVLIAAPHTTNWDLPHMLAASLIFRVRLSWMGKHTLFKPPMGWLLHLLGGVPVDRRAPGGLVHHVAGTLSASEQLVIAIPPSGTRGRSDRWKSGFYWIAHTAQVPIVCSYLDYGRRRAGLGFHFVPTGDITSDMDRIREFYASIRGKNPDMESTIVLKEELEGADPESQNTVSTPGTRSTTAAREP